MEQTYERGKLYDLPIIDLKPDPKQPRKSMDLQALEDLAASVKLKGIIQPILFRVPEDDPYLLIVAGERRYKAAQMADLLIIPGICVEGNASEIALIENVQRQDLTCIEEAEALKRLMEDEQYTQDQLSAVIGKPRTTITESLSLTNLPQAVRDDCRGDRTVNKKKLLDIARKKQQRAMNTAYTKYKEELQKELAGVTKTRVKLTAAAALCQTLDKSREKLEKTDIADWSEDDIMAANDSINRLREAIDNFTTPPTEGTLA
jgi:ParB family chromosome partitioning protein